MMNKTKQLGGSLSGDDIPIAGGGQGGLVPSGILPIATLFNDGLLSKEQVAQFAGAGPASSLITSDGQGTLTIDSGQYGPPGIHTNLVTTYVPSEANAAIWGESFYDSANAGSPRRNQVHAWGWNVGAQGGRLVANEAQLGFSVESFFQPGADDTSEFHLFASPNVGGARRVMTFQQFRSTGVLNLGFNATSIDLQKDGDASIKWVSYDGFTGSLIARGVTSPVLSFAVNDVVMLAGTQSGGGLFNICKISALDFLLFDPDGNTKGTATGGPLTVAITVGNLLPGRAGATQVGELAHPFAANYSDNFFATVGGGGFDSATAGAMTFGGGVATSVLIGKAGNGQFSCGGVDAIVRSPNGQYSLRCTDGDWELIGPAGLMVGANGAQAYFTVPIATSFAKDNLVDCGEAGQRWRTGRFATSVLTAAVDRDAAGTLALGGVTATGVQVGRAGQSVGFYGVGPVAKQAAPGSTTLTAAGIGLPIKQDSTTTGGTGATAYTVSDIVLALKNYGLLTA